MPLHFKTLAMIVTAGSLIALTGCIIDPNQNSSSGSPAGDYNPSNPGGSEWNRGCDDAKRGFYDQNKHNQAYKDGHNSCGAGGVSPYGGQQQGGVEAAKRACTFQFGGSGYVQTVTPLKPGFWEIIVTDNSGRKVACTADAQGTVSDWVQM